MLQRAGGWCEPVQKLIAIWFPSRFCESLPISNETRLPPLRAVTLSEVESDLPSREGNQGGTANVNSSLRSFDLGDFLIFIVTDFLQTLKQEAFYYEQDPNQ